MSYVYRVFCLQVVRIEWQVVALGVLHGGLLRRFSGFWRRVPQSLAVAISNG